MNVINPLKLLLPHQATMEPPEGVVLDANDKESRSLTQLELYSALLDRSYLHQLAAQAVLSNRPCQEAEQTLDELAKLSLERLKSDYEKRQEFIERGRERAKIELEEARKHSAAPDMPAAPAADTSAPAAKPDRAEELSEEKPSEERITLAPAPVAAMPVPPQVPVTPSPREKDLEQELAEAQKEKRGCADRLSIFERLGYSPRRSTAMRLFGTTSLAGSVIALAILFDSLTRDFPLFREMIDGMRAAFLPSEGHSQSAVMLGFVEVALLFLVPLALAGFLLRRPEIRKHTDAAHVKRPASTWIWGLVLLGAYVIALVATFSTGETASRLLLDFALSLGVTGVSASLVFFFCDAIRTNT